MPFVLMNHHMEVERALHVEKTTWGFFVSEAFHFRACEGCILWMLGEGSFMLLSRHCSPIIIVVVELLKESLPWWLAKDPVVVEGIFFRLRANGNHH